MTQFDKLHEHINALILQKQERIDILKKEMKHTPAENSRNQELASPEKIWAHEEKVEGKMHKEPKEPNIHKQRKKINDKEFNIQKERKRMNDKEFAALPDHVKEDLKYLEQLVDELQSVNMQNHLKIKQLKQKHQVKTEMEEIKRLEELRTIVADLKKSAISQ